MKKKGKEDVLPGTRWTVHHQLLVQWLKGLSSENDIEDNFLEKSVLISKI